MQKKQIETFIRKYTLGGILEKVRWVSANKTLKTTTKSDDGKFLAIVELANFDGFEDAEVGIFDTTKLCRMLSAPGDEISLSLVKDEDDDKRVIALVVEDTKVEVQYPAAMLDLIEVPPPLKALPPFEVEIKLTDDFISKFLKAKSSLPEVDLFSLVVNTKKNNRLEMVLGYSSNINNNRIALEVPAEDGKNSVSEPISFSAKVLKEIIAANSECKDVVLKVSEKGLAMVQCAADGFTCQYYLIKINVED